MAMATAGPAIAATAGRETSAYDGGLGIAMASMHAKESMRGESDVMSVSDAVRLIRDTPDWQRSAFAEEIWKRRRQRGTDK